MRLFGQLQPTRDEMQSFIAFVLDLLPNVRAVSAIGFVLSSHGRRRSSRTALRQTHSLDPGLLPDPSYLALDTCNCPQGILNGSFILLNLTNDLSLPLDWSMGYRNPFQPLLIQF